MRIPGTGRSAGIQGRRGLAIALLALAGLPGASDAAEVKLGVHVELASPAEMQRIAQGGTDLVRAPFKWGHVQPVKRGPYDWTEYDTFVGNAAMAGLPVLPTIVGSPRYARPGPAEQPTRKRDVSQFLRWARILAGRYGPGGDFWRGHPEIPPQPVGAWQIWNEPNLSFYWAGEPDPGKYAAFLEQTADAIHQSQPQAKIVLAGMPEQRAKTAGSKFLAELYQVPGFSKLFNAVAVHAYAKRGSGALTAVRRFRGVMDKGGDENKPIWVTELGWGSDGPASDPRVTTAEGQAANLSDSFTRLVLAAARMRLARIVWYDWRDRRPSPVDTDHFSFHTGLFSLDGEAKPAWAVFASLAQGDPGSGPLEEETPAPEPPPVEPVPPDPDPPPPDPDPPPAP